jgi:pimeloyl-ACP methyl ester carboxylesterase
MLGVFIAAPLILVLVALGVLGQWLGRQRDRRRYPPPGQLVDVGGYRLHFTVMGEGKPTVVFDSGIATGSLLWTRVAPEVAAVTRVCTFDHAGFGWSDVGPSPHTALELGAELERLLSAAEIEVPYIFVAHSYGLDAQLFAGRHPEKVVGMVFVDAMVCNAFARGSGEYQRYFHGVVRLFRILLTLIRLGILRLIVQIGVTGMLPAYIRLQPEAARRQMIAQLLDGKSLRAGIDMTERYEVSAEQLQGAPGVPDVPVVVISHGDQAMFAGFGGLSRDEVERAEKTWQEMQAEYAASFTHGRHVVAEGSGHDIPVEQPEVVIDAIRACVDAARSV